MLVWRMGRQMQSKVQNELEDAEVKAGFKRQNKSTR